MERRVLYYPDPTLRVACDPIKHIDDQIHDLAASLKKTLLASRGAGLAAPQIGHTKRMIALNSGHPEKGREEEAFYLMINPEIIEQGDEKASFMEGCLSLPAGYAEVARPSRVIVRYLDLEGNMQELEASSGTNPLFSACVQHEIDHLDGRLFIDHLSRTRRNIVIKAVRKEALEQSKEFRIR